MSNIFEQIGGWIGGLGNNIVRKGDSYVSPQADTRFKSKPSPDAYQRRPVRDTIDWIRGKELEPIQFSGSGESSRDIQQELSDLGWQVGDWTNNTADTTQMAPDYSRDQFTTEIGDPWYNFLENELLPLTRAFGIPDAIAASQAALESGRDPSSNPLGMQRNNQLLDYATLEDAINQGYHNTLVDILSYNLGVPIEQFNYSDYELEQLLEYLQYTEDPEKYTTRQDDPAYGIEGASSKRYEGHSPRPFEYDDLLMDTPEYRYYSR